MLQLTRKTDYAIVALAHLLRQQRDHDRPVSARVIAEAYHLPLPLLMNILKELAQARLVTSTRGATGGYRLAVEPGRVSLLEIVNAMEGPVKLTPCCDGLPILNQGCELSQDCPIQPTIQRVHERMIAFFKTVTLEELLEDVQPPAPGGRPEPSAASA
ncbi:MAG: Rrf2 family transcriptional regulator [Planctomycetota bacterium]